jgi:hypothetical protein
VLLVAPLAALIVGLERPDHCAECARRDLIFGSPPNEQGVDPTLLHRVAVMTAAPSTPAA